MSSGNKSSRDDAWEENEFLIPPGQPGSMMDRLASADNTRPQQLEFLFSYGAQDQWEVVRIATGTDMFIEVRRKRP